MRVLFLMAEFPKISETFLLHQISHLEKLGIELELFALGNPKEKRVHDFVELIQPRVKYLRSVLNPSVWYLNLRYLLKNPLTYLKLLYLSISSEISIKRFLQSWYFIKLLEEKEEKIDLIHAHFGFTGSFAVLLKRYFNVPLITYFYGIDASPVKHRKGDYKSLFKHGEVFFALSNDMVTDLKALGCRESKIKIVHVGIDMSKFVSVKKSRKRFGSNRIVAVGRFEEKKGFNDLIYAFKEIKQEISDAELNLIGAGELERDLKKLIRALKLKKDVRLLGFLPYTEVLKHISSSNVLVLPSYTAKNGDKEGTPVVLMDAGGLATPVVTTKHAGIPEVVINGRGGLLVKERDIKGLSESILKILRDPKLAEKLGKQGREHIEKEFNMGIQARKIKEIYEKT